MSEKEDKKEEFFKKHVGIHSFGPTSYVITNPEELWQWITSNYISKERVEELIEEAFHKGNEIGHHNAMERSDGTMHIYDWVYRDPDNELKELKSKIK